MCYSCLTYSCCAYALEYCPFSNPWRLSVLSSSVKFSLRVTVSNNFTIMNRCNFFLYIVKYSCSHSIYLPSNDFFFTWHACVTVDILVALIYTWINLSCRRWAGMYYTLFVCLFVCFIPFQWWWNFNSSFMF